MYWRHVATMPMPRGESALEVGLLHHLLSGGPFLLVLLALEELVSLTLAGVKLLSKLRDYIMKSK